jgi:hypothetical protein
MDLTFNSGASNPFAYFTKDKDNKLVRMTGVKAIIESKRAHDSSINTPLFDKNPNSDDGSETNPDDPESEDPEERVR